MFGYDYFELTVDFNDGKLNKLYRDWLYDDSFESEARKFSLEHDEECLIEVVADSDYGSDTVGYLSWNKSSEEWEFYNERYEYDLSCDSNFLGTMDDLTEYLYKKFE